MEGFRTNRRSRVCHKKIRDKVAIFIVSVYNKRTRGEKGMILWIKIGEEVSF